jgi:hypothetical protein
LSFRVRYTARAREDLLRLYEYLLDRSESVEDLTHADAALDAIERAVGTPRSHAVHLSLDDRAREHHHRVRFERDIAGVGCADCRRRRRPRMPCQPCLPVRPPRAVVALGVRQIDVARDA